MRGFPFQGISFSNEFYENTSYLKAAQTQTQLSDFLFRGFHICEAPARILTRKGHLIAHGPLRPCYKRIITLSLSLYPCLSLSLSFSLSLSSPIARVCARVGKGQMGSALMGSLQISCFLTEGPFGYSALPTFILPKVPGRTFFPNLSKIITFAAAPLVSTPFVRDQDARQHCHEICRDSAQVATGLLLCILYY